MKRTLLLALALALSGCCIVVRCGHTPPKPYTATKIMTRCVVYPWVDHPTAAADGDYMYPYIYGFYPLWIIEWPIQGLIDSAMYFPDKWRYNSYQEKADAEFNKVQKEHYKWLKKTNPKLYYTYIKKYPQWAVDQEDLLVNPDDIEETTDE